MFGKEQFCQESVGDVPFPDLMLLFFHCLFVIGRNAVEIALTMFEESRTERLLHLPVFYGYKETK